MVPLPALALLFVKLGTLAFGGPAGHIAMMRHEVVERRKWMRDADFLDLLGASNLIPGPSSTELAIHIGRRLGGWRGLILSGVCFILPAALLVLLMAWGYQKYGMRPQVAAAMRGVGPVVIAIVLDAVRGLAQASLRTISMMLVAALGFLLSALGMNPLLILILCGAAVVVFRLSGPAIAFLPFWATSTAASVSLAGIFGVFLKVGAVVFGSGYVLLAFLQADLVDSRHWLTSRQLLDAVAVGQVTPGPVFTTATFIGFLLGGVKGALAATVAIFLPGFVFVALSGPLIPRIRKSPIAASFLEGVTVGSIALIAWALLLLGRATLLDPMTIGIAVAGFVLLTRFRVNPALLVAVAGVISAFTH